MPSASSASGVAAALRGRLGFTAVLPAACSTVTPSAPSTSFLKIWVHPAPVAPPVLSSHESVLSCKVAYTVELPPSQQRSSSRRSR